MAGVVGPTIYDMVLKKTNSLEQTFFVFSMMFVVALVVSLLMKNLVSKAREENFITGELAMEKIKKNR